MSDSLVQVDIELLRQHPNLPEASDILDRFAEHHAQSEARRRSHDELMQSDSNLELEDFGALAASALGTSDGHDSILGEDAPSFADDELHANDTLPEQEAVPEANTDEITEESESDEASSDTDDDVNDQPEEELESDSEASDDDASLNAESELKAEESEADEAANAKTAKSEEASPKKRTRKRKKKKKS